MKIFRTSAISIFILAANLVLATTKNFSHRIYLSKGIFAEITVMYKKKQGFEALPWTYPDFMTPRAQEDLRQIRSIYMQQLNA